MSRKRPAHLIMLWSLILLLAGCSQARVRPVATQTSGFVETGGRSVVDHFEDYGDISSNRICQAWLDGEGFSPNSHFPAGYGGNGTHAVVGHAVRTAGGPDRNDRIMENTLVHFSPQAIRPGGKGRIYIDDIRHRMPSPTLGFVQKLFELDGCPAVPW